MGWKKIMHKENIQEQKEQKVDQASAPFAPFEDKNQNLKTDEDRAFDILDGLLAGGKRCRVYTWEKMCKAEGLHPLAVARIRFIEAPGLLDFENGIIKTRRMNHAARNVERRNERDD